MGTFSEVVEAADQLSIDEQITLLEVLRRRIAESGRESIVRDVGEARAEFESGDAQATTVSDLIHEVRGES